MPALPVMPGSGTSRLTPKQGPGSMMGTGKTETLLLSGVSDGIAVWPVALDYLSKA